MKKIILLIAAAVLGAVSARADTAPSQFQFYYVFHLYENTGGQLVPDRDFKFSYDVIPGIFIQPAVGQFPYRGEVVDLSGNVRARFQFDVQPGKLSVQAPYVADGQKIIFYNNQNQPVLTVPVSDSSYCNDNGICEADHGEDFASCPTDCKEASLPAAPTASASTAPSSSGIVSGLIYTLAGLALIGGGWWFMRRRRNPSPPSSYTPPPQMPTPPTPPAPSNPV